MSEEPLVVVVDDDESICDSLTTLFESVALEVACYTSAEDFLESWQSGRPGCLVLDLRMPGMSGLELQAELNTRGHHLPIVFLTAHGNVTAAVRAMQAGAMDFLTKPVDDEELIETVRKAIEQDIRSLRDRAAADRVRSRLASLTPRETDVLEGVVAGKSNKVIARDLGISHKTVELHRGHLMEKSQANSVADLVKMYLSVYNA